MSLNKELVEILACPTCKGPLVLMPREDGLLCESCQTVYPVKEDIPIMLPEEAVQYPDWHGSRP